MSVENEYLNILIQNIYKRILNLVIICWLSLRNLSLHFFYSQPSISFKFFTIFEIFFYHVAVCHGKKNEFLKKECRDSQRTISATVADVVSVRSSEGAYYADCGGDNKMTKWENDKTRRCAHDERGKNLVGENELDSRRKVGKKLNWENPRGGSTARPKVSDKIFSFFSHSLFAPSTAKLLTF